MSLVNKTKTALDESRMLMLGAQILLGFQLQAPFQNAFAVLSTIEKWLELGVLALIVGVVALLVMPSSFHRIAHDGEASGDIIRLIGRVMLVTLTAFALAMALDLGLAGMRIGGPSLGVAAGIIGFAICLGIWLAPSLASREEADMPTSDEKTPMAAKIDYVLTEARVVLPGAQAFLGFQLAVVLTKAFGELSQGLKWVHGLSLTFIVLATALLIAPAAYHRIAYGGRDSADFHRLSSRFLLLATMFLALGVSCDVYLVTFKIADKALAPWVFSIGTAGLLFGLWHVWPWLVGRRAV